MAFSFNYKKNKRREDYAREPSPRGRNDYNHSEDEDSNSNTNNNSSPPSAKREKLEPGDNSAKSQKDADGNTYFEISSNRRVTMRLWQKKALLDIREFYTDAAGDLKPGKKGISLSLEQFQTFKSLLPFIDKEFDKLTKL